jgi:flagellar basal-body rod modification protein FlgD
MKEISQTAPPVFSDIVPQGPHSKNTLGKDDFMKLLMTQLTNQDPLKPMDNQEFSSQLAQFSSLEQLANIGSGVQNLKSGFTDETKLQAIGMIGKRVAASGGSEISLLPNQLSVNLPNTLPEDVKPERAIVYDENGKVVRDMNLQDKARGAELFWDGKTDDGLGVPPGKYTFRLHGVGTDGKPHESGAEVSGKVTGAEIDGKSAVLVLETKNGTARVDMTKVRQVSMDQDAGAEKKVTTAPSPTIKTPTPEMIQAALQRQAESSEGEGGQPTRTMGAALADQQMAGYSPPFTYGRRP